MSGVTPGADAAYLEHARRFLANEPRTLRVVAGLLRRGPTVLMGLRGPEKLRPCLWEMPGGKVEDGEAPEVALAREWREELELDVTVGRRIATAIFEVEQPIVVDLYEVESKVGSAWPPLCRDHAELRWVIPIWAIRNLPCSPACYLHFPFVRDYMAEVRS